MEKLKIPIECYNCKYVTSPVDVDISESNVQERISNELIVCDIQRVCPQCHRTWNSIHIFYNKYGEVETAFGEG